MSTALALVAFYVALSVLASLALAQLIRGSR